MKLFGALHMALLAGVACAAGGLAYGCRRGILPRRAVRLAVGWTLAVNELVWWWYRYSREGIQATNLPLQLCDLTVWLAVAACLTAAPRVVELAYFAGIAGAGMALLTPDLYTPWPTYPSIYFFVAHGCIVIAAGLLAFGGFAPFRSGAVWRAFAVLLCYAALAGLVNAALGSNYMYLCRKPRNASLLDQMGPWPWYVATGAAVALALFGLLWLPVRPRAKSGGTGL